MGGLANGRMLRQDAGATAQPGGSVVRKGRGDAQERYHRAKTDNTLERENISGAASVPTCQRGQLDEGLFVPLDWSHIIKMALCANAHNTEFLNTIY